MKKILDHIFVFFVFGSCSGVFARIFGTSFVAKAGGSASALHGDSSNPILFLFFVALVVSTLLLSFPYLPRIAHMLLQTPSISALHVLAVLSIAWSVSPNTTFRGCVYMVIYMLAAAYIAIIFDMKKILHLISVASIAIAWGSIVAQILIPLPEDLVPGWTGLYGQKNWLGIGMAIGILSIVAEGRRWTIARMFNVALCGALLALSQSTTSMLCTACGVLVLYYFRIRKSDRLRAAFIAGGLVLVVFLMVPSASNLVFDVSGKDSTLSGRDVIWAYALRYILQAPVLGYGLSAFWSPESSGSSTATQFLGWNPGYSHNGYLDICLNMGILSLVLVIAVIAGAAFRGWRVDKLVNGPDGGWMLAIIVVLLLHNIAECDFMLGTPLWFMFVLTCFASWQSERVALMERANEVSAGYGVLQAVSS